MCCYTTLSVTIHDKDVIAKDILWCFNLSCGTFRGRMRDIIASFRIIKIIDRFTFFITHFSNSPFFFPSYFFSFCESFANNYNRQENSKLWVPTAITQHNLKITRNVKLISQESVMLCYKEMSTSEISSDGLRVNYVTLFSSPTVQSIAII